MTTTSESFSAQPNYEVAIIGSGLGGIASGFYLKRAGIENFVILEQADDLGGTWRMNTYPGVACDIPSIIYQFSFAYNPNWSRVFAPGAEIQAYNKDVATRFGLDPHFRFRTEVTKQVWDEDRCLWLLHTATGEVVTARYVIASLGPFHRPKSLTAAFAGIAEYRGKVLASSAWDHSFDVAGKHVAVIGTGASGVQLAAAIAPVVGSLTVYQRTAAWVGPKPDLVIPGFLKALQRVPGVVAALRGFELVIGQIGTALVFSPAFARPFRFIMRVGGPLSVKGYAAYIRSIVKDRETAAKLVPPYGIGTSRPTLSVNYHSMFNQDNVSLVTEAIERIVPEGIKTVDGSVREFDAIVPAIGWESHADAASYAEGTIIGHDGVDLGRFFTERGVQAYEGTAIPGFPNRWMLVGPYAWAGNGGWHALVELGARHAVRAIALARKRSAIRMEVRKDVHDAQFAQVRKLAGTFEYYFHKVYPKAPRTWLINSHGHFALPKPFSVFQNYWRAKHFPPEHYQYTQAAQQPTLAHALQQHQDAAN